MQNTIYKISKKTNARNNEAYYYTYQLIQEKIRSVFRNVTDIDTFREEIQDTIVYAGRTSVGL